MPRDVNLYKLQFCTGPVHVLHGGPRIPPLPAIKVQPALLCPHGPFSCVVALQGLHVASAYSPELVLSHADTCTQETAWACKVRGGQKTTHLYAALAIKP